VKIIHLCVVLNTSLHLQVNMHINCLVNYNNMIVKIRKHSFLFIKNVIILELFNGFLFQLHPCVSNVIMHPN
jgi:hypothetical protein